jgi:hypothetical protein
MAHLALVPESGTVDLTDVSAVAAAIQRQLVRDVAPLWSLDAPTVDSFPTLEDVPIGYWAVIITSRDLGTAAGVHLDDDGRPYALVEATDGWSVTASHECIEMVIDPSGNRTVPGPSPRPDQGRVEFLVEACDPCEAAEHAYTVNDVPLSDFYTPSYFEPVGSGARYSYTGSITAPRQILPKGYLSWHDPVGGDWWQRSVGADGSASDRSLGPIDRGTKCIREIINSMTPDHFTSHRIVDRQQHERLAALLRSARTASRARAARIRTQIERLGGGRVTSAGAVREPVPAVRVARQGDGSGTNGHASSIAAAASPSVGVQIDAAIRAVQLRTDLPRRDEVLDVLQRAAAQLRRGGDGMAGAPDATMHRDEFALALVNSALTDQNPPPSPAAALTGADILAGGQYADLDPRWIATFFNRLFRDRVRFPTPKPDDPLITPIREDITIAMAGDWGTGDASSLLIGRLIGDLKPDITIHLGDVYYSGTEGEERQRFVDVWPAGSTASFALNSNHEMYSGGHGYFGVALQNPKFRAQRGLSYFALEHSKAFVIGLDSAYFASDLMYQHGRLAEPMLGWMDEIARRASAESKAIVLLTHHQGLDYTGKPQEPLWSQVIQALRGGPNYWYWGHVHGAAVLHQKASGRGVDVRGRCMGHGGVPYAPDPMTPALVWTEQRTIGAGTAARALNGFVVLKLSNAAINETFYDERSGIAWSGSSTWSSLGRPAVDKSAGAGGAPVTTR